LAGSAGFGAGLGSAAGLGAGAGFGAAVGAGAVVVLSLAPAALLPVSGVTAAAVSVEATAEAVSVVAVATALLSAVASLRRSPPQAAASESAVRAGNRPPTKRHTILCKLREALIGGGPFPGSGIPSRMHGNV
jgi:hypothetical protein